MPSYAIFFLYFGWQHLHSCFLLSIRTCRAILFLYFQIKFSSSSVETLPFGFCLFNSECDASLANHHSLIGSYPKMFLLFLSLILSLIPGLKQFFSIHISFSFLFCFLLLDLTSCIFSNSVINFPQLVNLVFLYVIPNQC